MWHHSLTYSMEQSPSWEATWYSANQEIPRILWNPKVHYCNHKFLPLAPILSQFDPVHTPTSHFLKTHLNPLNTKLNPICHLLALLGAHPILHVSQIRVNIMLPTIPGSPKRSLSLRFPHQNPVYTSLLPIHATCPAHLILLDFINWTILGEQYRSLSSSLCSFLHSLLPHPP